MGLFFVSDCVTASFMTTAKRNIFKSNRINSVLTGWNMGKMNVLHSTCDKMKCVFYNSNLLECRH